MRLVRLAVPDSRWARAALAVLTLLFLPAVALGVDAALAAGGVSALSLWLSFLLGSFGGGGLLAVLLRLARRRSRTAPRGVAAASVAGRSGAVDAAGGGD